MKSASAKRKPRNKQTRADVATPPSESRADAPLRILTAVPICDGHDSAINTINLEFVRAGIEVIYLGYHRCARDIVRAAVQEDARAIGLSSYNGGHVEFFTEIVRGLRAQGAGDIGVFGGGGGTITLEDAKIMRRRGVDQIFFPGTPLAELARYAQSTFGRPRSAPPGAPIPTPPLAPHSTCDRLLARQLTQVQDMDPAPPPATRRGAAKSAPAHRPRVIGMTGPGGAGKTTLIDELVLRFLTTNPGIRIGILSHDPSIIGNGALLGDRATMIYSQDDRVFMRSLASRGQAGGLSPATEQCLRLLLDARDDAARFDLILVETVGIGQEALPFRPGLVDQTVLVMSPDYGSRLQLQKIAMFDAADVIVINKSDQPGARTASNEIAQRLALNGHQQRLVATTAKRHRDGGVDDLFRVVSEGMETR